MSYAGVGGGANAPVATPPLLDNMRQPATPPGSRRTGGQNAAATPPYHSPASCYRSAGDTPPMASAGAGGVASERRLLSRNFNGTFVMTSQPSNESELQLYRVLQRANLLHYFDTFISQGGDDVQQLCEAGEEEFLEIMALVGMASKPLHVRRLQKALQEWVQNPALFQTPLVPSLASFPNSNVTAAAAAIRAGVSGSGSLGGIPTVTVAPSILAAVSLPTSVFAASGHSVLGSMVVANPASAAGSSLVLPSSLPQLMVHSRVLPPVTSLGSSSAPSPSPPLSQPAPRTPSTHSPSPQHQQQQQTQQQPVRFSREPAMQPSQRPPSARQEPPPTEQDTQNLEDREEASQPSPLSSQGDDGGSTSPLQLTPVLIEAQIQRIAETALALVKSLPDLEPKHPHLKKKICKELEHVLTMPEEDGRKMEEIRKYSAIYGRFDCKRKAEKPLTLHEVSVNEAAAQICRLVPAMLTRRDELFPLARQVVRDSGYQYSKGHSRSTFSLSDKLYSGDEGGSLKRMRFSEDSETTQRRKERIDEISDESRIITDRLDELRSAGGAARTAGDLSSLQQISQQMEILQSKHQQLILEREDHTRIIRYNSRLSTSSDPERGGDTDEDNNSPRSYSNRSSPAAGQLTAPAAAYVLSASGGQIIAVQNPALSLSSAFPPPRVGAAHTVTLSSMQGNPLTLMTTRRLPASTPPGGAAMKQEPSSPASPPVHREKD